jgi:hypothetical protein
VVQDIRPVTSWFSPQIDLNFAGSREIEAEVVARVASYGKQLGIMSETLIELADGKRGPALERLQRLMREVEEVKARQQHDLEDDARDALARLEKSDPAALERLLRTYRRDD